MSIENNQLVVTCIDSFMSGWGKADGKKNKLVFICKNHAEADIVESNARARGDQSHVKQITISDTMRNAANWSKDGNFVLGDFYVQIKTKEDYPNWYKPDFWKKSD